MSDWKLFQLGRGTALLANNDFCFYDYVPEFVHDSGRLPTECCNCYKVLVFWDGRYSGDNIRRFKSMLSSLPYKVNGKYNDVLAVIYTDSSNKCRQLRFDLESGLRRFDVSGRIQWRVACREWQDEYPDMFSTAKSLLNPSQGNEYSIEAWLTAQGIDDGGYDSWG